MGRSRPAAYSGMAALEMVLLDRQRQIRRSGSSRHVTAGVWRLETDEDGNLVAVHGPTGQVTLLASAPVEDGGSDG